MSIFRKIIPVAVIVSAMAGTFVSAHAEELTWTKGVIKKINEAQSKVTVKHEAIENLDMPSMTMIFFVPDPKVFGKLKEGEAKEFAFGDQLGRMIVKDVK